MSCPAAGLTLFPEMFPGVLGVPLVGKALDQGRWTTAINAVRTMT